MEFYFFLIYMGVLVYWLIFAWHWRRCTVRK